MIGNFTKEDIDLIKNEVKTNIIFQYYGTSIMNVRDLIYNQVIRVSDKGLILVKGNSQTAYEHIIERHLFWSFKPYPVGNEFQAQSKFPSDIAPIHFTKIADIIYVPENKIVKNEHEKSGEFDKYQGTYKFDGVTDEVVNLILYKDTKIIHSLYPQNKQYNKNKNRGKYPFTRGKVEIRDANLAGTIKEVYIPYFSRELKLKFVICITKTYLKDTEEFKILVYDDSENYIFEVLVGEKRLIKFTGDKSMITTYQHTELRQMEELMLKIENEQKNTNS